MIVHQKLAEFLLGDRRIRAQRQARSGAVSYLADLQPPQVVRSCTVDFPVSGIFCAFGGAGVPENTTLKKGSKHFSRSASGTVSATATMCVILLFWHARNQTLLIALSMTRQAAQKAITFALMLVPAIRTAILVGAGYLRKHLVARAPRAHLLVGGVGDRNPAHSARGNAGADDPALAGARRRATDIGVTALVYTIVHVVIYFLCGSWNFLSIVGRI